MRVVIALLVTLAVAMAASSDRTVMFTRTGFPSMWNMVGFPNPQAEVKFLVSLKQRNLDLLDKKFWAVSDPASPEYQNFMTNTEVLELIAPCPLEKKAVKDWLVGCGCTKMQDNGDAFAVIVSVEKAEQIFQTQFFQFSYAARNITIIRQMGPMSVPSSVFPYITQITGIAEFPIVNKGPRVYAPQQAQLAIIPATLNVVYHIPEGQSAKGSQQGVGEFGSGEMYDAPSLAQFATDVGVTIPPLNPDHIITPESGEGIEGDLDIQYIAGVGQGGDNWYWTAQTWLLDFCSAFSAASAKPDLISLSYGWWEGAQCDIDPSCTDSTKYVESINTEFQKIGVQGVSLICASGDSGANGRTDPDCTVDQLRPAFPAASPYITSVGATQLNNPVTDLSNQPPICTSGAYSCASGGDEVAVSYDVASFTSGGGFSNISSRPSYQDAAVQAYLKSGVTLPPSSYYNANGRGLPDVASLGTAIYINSAAMGGGGLVGGTSASSPSWAGYMSLLNAISRQKTGKPLGFLNPMLYSMWAAHPTAFKDITSGDNICTEDGCAPTCKGFLATKGWDPVTGLGAANVAEMINYMTDFFDAKAARAATA